MGLAFDDSTSASLLARLRHDAADQDAWKDFVRRYGPHIYRWCRNWHLQEADAEDVTQTVLTKLAVKMRTFSYDATQSFRAYLKTVTHYALRDFLDSRKDLATGTGDSGVLASLESVAARDDLVQRLSVEFDQEVLAEAMDRVRQRVEPHTWEAFRLTAEGGASGAAVAGKLGMRIATVYKAKSKVQKLLREEIETLEAEPQP